MSDRSNLPLSRFALPTARGVEQCREAVAQFLCENTVDARENPRELELHMRVAPLSPAVALGMMHWTGGADVSARNSGDCHNFVNLLDGQGKFTAAGREVDHAASKRAVVMAPERPSRAVSDRAITALCVRVDRSLVESHLNALMGIELSDGLEFDREMPLTGEAGSIWRFAGHIVEEIDRDANVLRSPLVMDRLSDTLLTGLLCAQPHNYSALLNRRATSSGPSCVRIAEEYLEAHCNESITAERLAEAIGVSLSALYEGFKRYRAHTPMQFLKRLRLRRARAQLLTATEGTTVREVALRWGFSHLGRFSADYRREFGESPSETLRGSGRKSG